MTRDNKSKKYQHDIGDVVYRFRKKEHYLKILGHTTIQRIVKGAIRNEMAYRYECITCGYIGEKQKDRIENKEEGCPVCSSRKVVAGYNDIATTHPHVIEHFVNKEDAKKYSMGSHKKVDFKCIECGFEKNMDISSFMAQGIGCPRCKDGFSYPTKIITNILLQTGVEFVQEVGNNTLYWVEKFRYDFYIPSINCIIEAHGRQHYDGGFNTLGGKNKDDEITNDSIKKSLAIENNILHYIEIDCRTSRINHIKNSIIESGLLDILGIEESEINWKDAHLKSTKGNLIIACELWNKYKDMRIIEDEMKISRSALTRYLKSGAEIGLCDYSVKEQRSVSPKSKARRVEMFKDKIFLKKYESANEIERISKEKFGVSLFAGEIRKVCKNERDSYKGYWFKYEERG